MDAQKSNNPFIVVIDPGHGGKDPGAIGKISLEKDINLIIAKKLGDLIKQNHKDVKLIYTRTTDKKILPKERAEFANRQKADLFISVHANARGDKQVKGTEIYIYGTPNGKNKIDEKGQQINNTYNQNRMLAEEIRKAFKKGKRIDLGIRHARFLVLKYALMPAVLVEVGFISNENEEKYMNSVAGQKAISNAIYEGFANYKKNYKSGKSTTTTPPKTSNQTSTTVKDKSKSTTSTTTASTSKGRTYRIQIFISDRKLPSNSPNFKGLSPVDHYVDRKIYKYTYGNSSDIKETKKQLIEVKKLFKDAFIVIFENGKRVGIYTEK